MDDGLTFKPLELDDLGEGVSRAQIEHQIATLARLLGDIETYAPGTRASVTLRVDLVRDDDAVAITAGVTVSAPKAKKKKTYAFVDPSNGVLKVQKSEQLTLETMRREMAARGMTITTPAKGPGAATPGDESNG